jgi:hypothetical protein
MHSLQVLSSSVTIVLGQTDASLFSQRRRMLILRLFHTGQLRLESKKTLPKHKQNGSKTEEQLQEASRFFATFIRRRLSANTGHLVLLGSRKGCNFAAVFQKYPSLVLGIPLVKIFIRPMISRKAKTENVRSIFTSLGGLVVAHRCFLVSAIDGLRFFGN